MTLQAWWAFTLTELALCLTPGPAVLFVLGHALGHGAARSVWASLGVLATNAIYFALSAAGLGAVLLASHSVFVAIKYAGAAYLIWLGISTLRGRGLALDATATSAPLSGPSMMARGMSIQAANPKAVLFFTALLPQFIRPDAPVASQFLVLGVTSIVIEFIVLAGYAVVAGRAAETLRRPAFATATNRIAGVLLVGAGVGLASAGEG